MKYRRTRVIGGRGAAPERFRSALRGICLDGSDQLYAVGDQAVKVFDPRGKLLRTWRTGGPGSSVAVAPDGRVFVGETGQVEIFNTAGKLLATWRDGERLGLVTAIGFHERDVFLADAKSRSIRRYDADGNFQLSIGQDNRMKGFSIPNGYLDFCLDTEGVIHAANPGKHRVERYSREGKLLGRFGQFGMQDPAHFRGCCNPTNLTLHTGGQLLVTEKAGPRAKVYDSARKLLAVIDEEEFDRNAKNMDIAVDRQGRIYVTDPVRLQILVFTKSVRAPAEPRRSAEPAGGKRDG